MALARHTGRLAALALISGLLVTTGAGTAYAADPVVGAQTSGDSLFPNQGNGGYDALHYDIDLKVNVAVSGTNNAAASTTFETAKTTIDAKTTDAPLSSYSLDFQGSTGNLAASTLNVDSVTVDGEPAEFSRIENTTTSNAVTDKHKLIVTPATPVSGEFTTVVVYSGKPVAHTDTDSSLEGWNNTTDGATFLNQPVGSMTAFPNNNTPRDKATYDISIDIPSKLTTSATAVTANPGLKDAAAVSNGELVSKTPNGDGSRTTWKWKQSRQMASMLSLISIGRYDMYTSDINLASGRTLPEWTFIDPAISAANQNTTQASRAQAKQILDHLESKYGPYPGGSTGFVTDVVPGGINYALETQDRSFFPNAAGRGTTIHEITHQWYGDNVSPGDWNDIWISEGTATFAENSTNFESSGTSTNSNETSYYSSFASSSPTSSLWTTPPAGMTQASQLFGAQSYTRGSWTLEALRTAIGVPAFDQLMKEWQSRNGGKSRRTADFIALAEEVSGRSLTAFFQQWVFANTKATWPSKFDLTLTGPEAPAVAGEAASFTLTSRNTGKVAQTGSVVTLDLADVLDDATIGTLPAGTTLDGTTLTWTVPTTALGATSTVTIPVTTAADANGSVLAATARASTLGSTCVSCTSSVAVGSAALSPTADPTITGSPVAGQTLTAGTAGWPSRTTFTYRWLAGGVSVPGATSATFKPDAYTVGQAISVRVTGTKGGLNATRTSAATAAVTRATQTVGTPTISGTPQFGKRLTVTVGAAEPGSYFTYQWKVNGVDVSAANGGTGPSFVPAIAAQLGQTVTVLVTTTKSGYSNATSTSAATEPIAAGVFDPTPTPTLSAAPKVGTAVRAVAGPWEDGTTLTYQWSADGSPITGATAVTYTPTAAQLGASLSVTVTANKPGYPTTTRASEGVAVQTGTQTLTPTPTTTGSGRAGDTLTGVPGTWDAGTTLSYQWLIDGTPIEGATETTYTPTATQIGKDITFAVTSAKTGYESVTRTSAAVTVLPLAQTSTPTPTITGTPKVGVELTGVPGTWDDGVTLTYQWLADGDPVSGATDLIFTPGAAQSGKAITFAVTGTRADYETVTKTSDATDPVADGTFDPTPTPTITGTPKVGVELTAVAGDWDEDAELAYQWLADSDEIDGATDSTYTPVADQVGDTISVTVTGTKDGYVTVSRTSDETDEVAKGTLDPAPVPTISGTAKVGVQLTVTPGVWGDGAELSYQWLSGGEEVEGATGTTFTPGVSEVGEVVTVAVTGTRDGYETLTRTSAPTTPVGEGDQVNTPVPTVDGTLQVGKTVSVVTGSWDDDATLTYQWARGGRSIPGATGSTYTLTYLDRDLPLTVTVTGTRSGYVTVSRTSVGRTVAAGVQVLRPKPEIYGVTKVGRSLYVRTATYDQGVRLSYAWYAGTTKVGSNKNNLLLTSAHRGKKITVKVTQVKTGYTNVTGTSAPTAAVTK